MPMKRNALVAAGAVLLLTGTLAMPADAQQEVEERCKKEATRAAGAATILGKGRARRLAITNWQREVRAKFGERYMDFNKSREASFECEAASVGALGRFNQRCIVSAHPCRIVAIEDDATIGESEDARNTFRVQRLLARAGYLDAEDVDGEFGDRTRRAVRRFQRDEGLRVTGEISDETLERLRRRAG
jgi:hypothetical protein